MVFRFLASKLIFQFLTWFECLTSERARAQKHTRLPLVAKHIVGSVTMVMAERQRMWWHVDAGADGDDDEEEEE